MTKGQRMMLRGFVIGLLLACLALGVGAVIGYQLGQRINEPHRVISGAVCGADELAVPTYATACAEAKSACGSGCEVWDDATDLSGIPGFSDPPQSIPPDVEAPANIATAAAGAHTATPDPFSLGGQ